MRLLDTLLRIGVLLAATVLCVQGQQEAPAKEGPPDAKGLPPRAAAADYQSQAQAGPVAIGAEFTGHSLPTAEGPLTSEEFIAVEVGLFGAPDARLLLSASEFSLRVNGKKMPLESQPYGLLNRTLRDPEWLPPEPPEPKSKGGGGLTGGAGGNGGGGGQGPSLPPLPPKVPVPTQRAWAQRLQKAALPEGDRPLPQAGLVFFPYRGKTEKLETVELIYEGVAGKAIVKLLP